MNGPLAYIKNWAAAVFAEQSIPLPASMEFLDTSGKVVCRFTVMPNGQVELQEGNLPNGGHYQVRFTSAGRAPIIQDIDIPA